MMRPSDRFVPLATVASLPNKIDRELPVLSNVIPAPLLICIPPEPDVRLMLAIVAAAPMPWPVLLIFPKIRMLPAPDPVNVRDESWLAVLLTVRLSNRKFPLPLPVASTSVDALPISRLA